ncbi:flagellar hook-associated protein FlgL [Paenibacillus sp. PAMC21692]|uniref:flagellar hook-associated protein FlgL n=1 Tax=Paenibacillus sp. PAMC21692 TaxID=2762320 RepID=UPI00164CEF76|nr:flagellar hook-associated protein FlgL [Paenibacillus sp. PAMC21692]QNK58356.1 flagellar hook-associated protein FlgL [Paenibacillus sp. PAMC21692]
MRVTGMMQNTQLLKNLRNTNSGIVNWQNQLATGQKIHRPGDDPVGIGYQMRYDTELARSDEFLENARTGTGWLNTMDSNLQQATEILQRAKVLTQQALNGTTPEDARKQIASEILQLKEQMVAVANSSYDGRYMFNGQKTDVQPYSSATAATDVTDTGMYYLNVSPFVTVPVSISGEQIFGASGSPDNVFLALDEIYNNLIANDVTALSGGLTKIDAAADRISLNLAEVGARTNRFELVENRLLDEQVGLKQLRAQVADVDMPEALIQLQTRENIMQASLATGARIMQVSLIDFIR